jgi:amino acid transporter
LQTAEEYGYVQRGLKSRHIQFIALGGTIGTGLFLGIGTAFANAGPVSVLIGYAATGVAIFGMMQCLGEMATWLPLPGAIPQYCARYVDPALGFAVGWNNCESNCQLTLNVVDADSLQGTNAPLLSVPRFQLPPFL